MANEIDALLARVDDPALRKDLKTQFDGLRQKRRFGLVFEEHLPERVTLPHHPIRRGTKVVPQDDGAEPRAVVTVNSGVATLPTDDGSTEEVPLDSLVAVAEFGEPIYPGLKRLGSIVRGGDKPAHVVIKGENHHALEALQFTHAGKIDCIYIDPPYNTRARDWKYNNDYVDPGDSYAHSKWLAFMRRRLLLAQQLLNPDNSVLIVTIDENEVHRLSLLLEQTFASSRIRMISSLINSKGVGVTEGFKRVDEYLLILRLGDQGVTPRADAPLGSLPIDGIDQDRDETPDEKLQPIGLDWQTARRRDLASVRPTRPSQFYPIYVDVETGRIDSIGDPIPHEMNRFDAPQKEGCVAVFPLRDDGTEMNWGVTGGTFEDRWKKGYCRAGKATPAKPQQYIIQYLKRGSIQDIEDGRAVVEGRNSDGSVVAFYKEETAKAPPSQWNLRSHNAEHYGTKIVRALLPGRTFPYPKSLFAVEDALRLFVSSKPEATIVDFSPGRAPLLTQWPASIGKTVADGSRSQSRTTKSRTQKQGAWLAGA